MIDRKSAAKDHIEVTRRYFLQMGAAGTAALTTSPLWAANGTGNEALERAIAKLEYLTPLDKFRFAGRGNPPPWQLPEDKRHEVGLTPETWQLEVVADPESNCKIGKPMSKDAGTAFGWGDLMRLAEQHAVRYLKVMTCLNVPSPHGMGLWEGVPLREVIWQTQPISDIRRLYYYGYDNDDPKQRFQSSLSINRVFEDPPGADPVILCYKLNGKLLSPKAGGPVRVISPEGYGFHNIKWLQRIVLTNDPAPNDNYARQGLDTDSPMKTFARFVDTPRKAKVGRPTPITGLAQVGISGLSRVQYWLHPQGDPLPPEDPHFTKADWKDADILPPPEYWGSEVPDGKLPPDTRHIDAKTGKPDTWPLPYTVAHWAVLLTDLQPGRYDLRCRTIDSRGIAQPMPRPFAKSGEVRIHHVTLVVEP